MQLIRGLHNLRRLAQSDSPLLADGCVATIGNFDGVHRGHQVIIDQVHEKARELGVPSVVMVFEPQPREFFAGDKAPPRLMRFREKVEALAEADVDVVVCLQFNHRLRNLSAMDFIEQVLIDGLKVRHLVVGDDFRFGCDRAGDFHLLQDVGEQRGFSVAHTRTITERGERISSTRVRQALEENRLADARGLLGHAYSIAGRVNHGQRLGRQIGAPTANIPLGRHKPPLRGVFVVQATRENGDSLNGVANIGLRPTVNGKQPLLEVHFFDFDSDLYGERLVVGFLSQLRDEVRFDSLDALKAQIMRDMDDAREWLARHPDPEPENNIL
ncbi:bifunctional riboflavin kinase/FAD synthetase [Marinobacteraceae bacterium S3BR75-40.1]